MEHLTTDQWIGIISLLLGLVTFIRCEVDHRHQYEYEAHVIMAHPITGHIIRAIRMMITVPALLFQAVLTGTLLRSLFSFTAKRMAIGLIVLSFWGLGSVMTNKPAIMVCTNTRVERRRT